MNKQANPVTEDAVPTIQVPPGLAFSVRILAVIAICMSLYFARSFFMPIVLGLILALTLSPIVRGLARLSIPPVLGAAIALASVGGVFAAGVSSLAVPFSDLVSNAPRIGAELKYKLRDIREPVEEISEATEEAAKITENVDDQETQEVVVKQPGLISRATDNLAAVVATTMLTFVLAYFLLVSRELFLTKTIRVLPTLKDKKNAISIANSVERDVSRYLLTIAIINSGLGICVATVFWFLGMPNPLLLGVMAGLLNFLPYVGSLFGIIVAAIIAIVTFDQLSTAFLVPASYLALTVIEGQFLTPATLGRSFSVNTVIILVSLAFWGFLWGVVGVLIAVPILIIIKAVCERVESLSGFAEFLSGRVTVTSERPVASNEPSR